MPNKFTNGEFNEKLFKTHPNIKAMEEYVDIYTQMNFKCKCGNEWRDKPTNLLRNKGCKICSKNESFYNKLRKSNKNHNNIIINSQIGKWTDRVNCKCKICGHNWDTTIGILLTNHGCPECARKKTYYKKQSKEVFQLKTKNNSKVSVIGDYIDSKTKIKCKCNTCGYEFYKNPTDIKYNGGCPKCQIENKKTTHEDFVDKIKNVNKSIIVIGKYKRRVDKIKCLCTVCNNIIFPQAGNLANGQGCPICTNKQIKVGYNDLHTTHPHVSKYLYNKNDGYSVSGKSNKKLNWVCPECGEVLLNKSVSNVVGYKLSCHHCGDGISTPEKMMLEILKQLKVNFEYQKIFKWSKPRRYDFYFIKNNQEYLLEVDGGFHIKNSTFSNLHDVKENDRLKDELAKRHNICVIRIPCYISKVSIMKQSVGNSKIANIYDVENINWELIEERCAKSFVKQSWDMYNAGLSFEEIGERLKLNKNTIRTYIKRGNNCGKVDYDPITDGNKNRVNKNIKKVICLTNGKIYNSIKDACADVGVGNSTLSMACKGKHGAGKDINGKTLKWMLYKDYIKQQEQNQVS